MVIFEEERAAVSVLDDGALGDVRTRLHGALVLPADADYDEVRHQTDEPAYHDEVGKYYDPWGGSPPMERSL